MAVANLPSMDNLGSIAAEDADPGASKLPMQAAFHCSLLVRHGLGSCAINQAWSEVIVLRAGAKCALAGCDGDSWNGREGATCLNLIHRSANPTHRAAS